MKLTTLAVISLLFIALAGCMRVPEEAKDFADDLGDALDDDPQYVDEPAKEPLEPR